MEGKARVGDRYDDVKLPWPDVNVAQISYMGGACKHAPRKYSGVSKSVLMQHVAPNNTK